MIKYLIIFIFVFYSIYGFNQSNEGIKTLRANRIHFSLDIYNFQTDSLLKNADAATDFLQISPENGHPSALKTYVYAFYNDRSVYFVAELNTGLKLSVNQLSERDEFGQSDFFGIYIDPYGDAKTAYGFFVTQPGVQIDLKLNHNGSEDTNWDAVWNSHTYSSSGKWTALIQIPYSALRFPRAEKQQWRINFFRNDVATREKSSWCLFNRELQNPMVSFGILNNIENINPPLRLSFTPYIAAYTENYSTESKWSHSIKGGMDVKFGFYENYTLDMILIPDFGQVVSDEKVLNLTPFETYYDEKRPFFTEGTELFEKGGIFYSRRIGGTPKDSKVIRNIPDSMVIENPSNTQLINATKISGKSSNGFGLGLINAMTADTWAIIKDTVSREKKKILTQPFSNYNLVVIDQSFGKNSYISLINTNLTIPGWYYISNVNGIDFKISTKDGSYAVSGIGNLSYINDRNISDSSGFRYYLKMAKTNGKFTFSFSENVESNQYNPNDMGYLQNPNEFTHSAVLRYRIFKPVGKMLETNSYLNFSHSMLFNPRKFTDFYISFQNVTTFVNYLTASVKAVLQPLGEVDFFEARVPLRKFNRPKKDEISFWISPDYRKAFLIDANAGVGFSEQSEQFDYWLSAGPRLRFSDRLFIVLNSSWMQSINDQGYYKKINSADSIIFSKREIKTWINSISGNYYFGAKSGLSIRIRHYWTRVDNQSYHTLLMSGDLGDQINGFNGRNLNFNAFTVDLAFTWHFAPGSTLSMVWKNEIRNENYFINNHYFDNFGHMISSPQINNLSVKVLYYLDYLNLVKTKADTRKQAV